MHNRNLDYKTNKNLQIGVFTNTKNLNCGGTIYCPVRSRTLVERPKKL